MATDLTGIAAIIGALGSVAVAAFAQFNVRRAAKSAKDAAEATGEAVGGVAAKVDGRSDRQDAAIAALTQEVARLQNPDATTPTRAEAPNAPVTINDGVPRVETGGKTRATDGLTNSQDNER